MKTYLLSTALILTNALAFAGCVASEDQTIYVTGNVWIGYVNGGTSFNNDKGYVNEENRATLSFEENFGNTRVNDVTNGFSILTDTFGVQYKLHKSFAGTRINYNMTGGSVLAMTLNNFKGVITDKQQVNLNWATMMETGVDHYEIERSGDGMNFLDMDQVESKVTINTNDYQLNYQYTDTHALPGTSFYRVKVIGKNGAINQTPVVQINNVAIAGTRIYPTVIQNNMVFVESDKTLREVKMEIFDLSGNKISETHWDSLNGRQQAQVSKAGGVSAGTYVARLTANGENIKSQLVIIQKF